MTQNLTQLSKWNSLISSFNYGDHLHQINYLDLFSLLHQDVTQHSELRKEITFKSSMQEDLASKKSRLLGFSTPRNPGLKRKRNTFEDTSIPRILNSDQRLQDLLQHSQRKEEEEKLKSHRKKKVKLTQENYEKEENKSIMYEKGYSQNTENQFSQRTEIENSLADVLPITEVGWSSTLVSENNKESIHDLILPLNFQTGNIFCRNDIVRN